MSNINASSLVSETIKLPTDNASFIAVLLGTETTDRERNLDDLIKRIQMSNPKLVTLALCVTTSTLAIYAEPEDLHTVLPYVNEEVNNKLNQFMNAQAVTAVNSMCKTSGRYIKHMMEHWITGCFMSNKNKLPDKYVNLVKVMHDTQITCNICDCGEMNMFTFVRRNEEFNHMVDELGDLLMWNFTSNIDEIFEYAVNHTGLGEKMSHHLYFDGLRVIEGPEMLRRLGKFEAEITEAFSTSALVPEGIDHELRTHIIKTLSCNVRDLIYLVCSKGKPEGRKTQKFTGMNNPINELGTNLSMINDCIENVKECMA